jgi:hypothetical protein
VQIEIFGGTSTRNAWLMAGTRVLHWDGKDWALLPPLNRPGWSTSALWGERRDDLWAISSGGANAIANGLPAALHFDGRTWREVPRPSSDTDLKALGGTGGVLFARDEDGSILRWTDTAWTRALWPSVAKKAPAAIVMAEQHRGPDSWPHDLAITGTSSGLALGGSTTLLAWQGGRWRASRPESATSVWESPAGEAWASTAADWNDDEGPRGGLLRHRGDRWERVADASAPLLRVVGVAGDVWAVGPGGMAVRCRQDACAAVPTGTRDDLIALWADGERVWAAGRGGSVLTWEGTRWITRRGTRAETLRSAWGSDDGYVVGVGPTAPRLGTDGVSVWDGKDWAGGGNPCQVGVATVVPDVLTRVAGRSRTDLWVIGTCSTPRWMFPGCPDKSLRCLRGVIAHSDGGRWKVEKLFDLRDIPPAGLTVSASEVWVSGAQGLVLRRDPQGWSQLDIGTVGLIHTILPSARGGLWIIAAGDATPRYVQPKPNRQPPVLLDARPL